MWLVTGGARFIGLISWTRWWPAGPGDVIDNLSAGTRENLAGTEEGHVTLATTDSWRQDGKIIWRAGYGFSPAADPGRAVERGHTVSARLQQNIGGHYPSWRRCGIQVPNLAFTSTSTLYGRQR